MSGHFATLLRGTTRTLLRDHQVFITDWLNPRDIKLEHGKFGLEDYTQPSSTSSTTSARVATSSRCASPASRRSPRPPCSPWTAAKIQPASLTLMAGPIDVRIAPNKVNELAMGKPFEWFRDNLIGIVPAKFEGGGRQVYPGFLQLSAFLSMNPERHRKAFADLFQARIDGDVAKATAIKDFYKDYFAIMDMTADFYLETIDQVFQRFLLPKGEMMFKGRAIDRASDQTHFSAHGRRRKGRYLLGRPDAGGPGPLLRA